MFSWIQLVCKGHILVWIDSIQAKIDRLRIKWGQLLLFRPFSLSVLTIYEEGISGGSRCKKVTSLRQICLSQLLLLLMQMLIDFSLTTHLAILGQICNWDLPWLNSFEEILKAMTSTSLSSTLQLLWFGLLISYCRLLLRRIIHCVPKLTISTFILLGPAQIIGTVQSNGRTFFCQDVLKGSWSSLCLVSCWGTTLRLSSFIFARLLLLCPHFLTLRGWKGIILRW